jgi:DNA-binding response OmpR family regulator
METVLLIEDNKDIRENMREILELAGYRVLLGANGKEGAAIAMAEIPDIIVCDIMMPELDGYGVIHLLQKNEKTKNIPFIFLTAKTERAEIRKGMELGADDYITKPFEGTELLNAISTRLKKAASQKTESTLDQSQPRRTIEQAFEELGDSSDFRKKQVIYSERHHAHRLFRVVSGKVKTYKLNEDGKELVTGLYSPGDYFGYIALLQNTAYQESAAAMEDSEIASIQKIVFREIIESNSEELHRFVKILAGNITVKEQQLLGMAYDSLRKKVASALLQLSKKYKAEGQSKFAMQISRENLAALAGTAKESLIRTLSDFKDEGLIDIQASNITILNEKKLEM